MQKSYKRHIKNFLLGFLIILSFVLVIRVWSVGYYFDEDFSAVKQTIEKFIKNPLGGFKQEEASHNLKYYLRARRIVLNNSNKRTVLFDSDENYNDAYSLAIDTVKKIQTGETKVRSKEIVFESEYYSVLKSKSMLVDYDNLYDYRLFSKLTDAKENTTFLSDISAAKEFIISFGDNALGYMGIYIKDYKTGNIYKYMIEADKQKIDALAEKILSETEAINAALYSFELDFHKRENTDGTQPLVVFSPLTSISLFPEKVQTIISKNYAIEDTDYVLNESEILKNFNINAVSVRKYTDIDGSKVYVENDATLKISPLGFLEYQALDGGRGINISRKTEKNIFDISDAVDCASDFTAKLSKSLPQSPICSLKMTGDMLETQKQGVYRMYFDYYAFGLPIFQIDADENIENAVTCEVENGYLKYYKHYIKTYANTENQVEKQTIISAADDFVSKTETGAQIVINKAYDCFVDDGKEELSPKWLFVCDGEEGIIRR